MRALSFASFHDDPLGVEIDAQRASTRLWLEMRTPEGRALAATLAVRTRELQRRWGGIEALDDRQLAALMEALRIECHSALQEGDPDAMVAAAEELVRIARPSVSTRGWRAG